MLLQRKRDLTNILTQRLHINQHRSLSLHNLLPKSCHRLSIIKIETVDSTPLKMNIPTLALINLTCKKDQVSNLLPYLALMKHSHINRNRREEAILTQCQSWKVKMMSMQR